jgi:hypothetical protein
MSLSFFSVSIDTRRSREQKRKEDAQDDEADDVSDEKSASPTRKSKSKKGVVNRRSREQKGKEDAQDDEADDVSDEKSASPPRKSKSKKGLVNPRSREQKGKEDAQDDNSDDVSDEESAFPPRKSKSKKGHHEKDDSQSKKRKSKGKGASPRQKGPTKDQEAAPASVKRKTPPSGTRTVEKKNRKKGNLDGSGSENDDSDFEKTPSSKKQRIKKGKKETRKSVGGVNNDVGEDYEVKDARTPSRYIRIS